MGGKSERFVAFIKAGLGHACCVVSSAAIVKINE